jgi:hypothetical protein
MLADTEYVKLLFSIQEKEFDLDNMGMIPYLRANLVKKNLQKLKGMSLLLP